MIFKVTILEAAKYVGEKLLDSGCMVHIYVAYSTNSVYLKIDAGAACSVRFSDHEGKQHLSYRFNYMAAVPGSKVITLKGDYERYFYQAEAIDQLIADILKLRNERKRRYIDYDSIIKKNIHAGREEKGFWQGASNLKDYLRKAG